MRDKLLLSLLAGILYSDSTYKIPVSSIIQSSKLRGFVKSVALALVTGGSCTVLKLIAFCALILFNCMRLSEGQIIGMVVAFAAMFILSSRSMYLFLVKKYGELDSHSPVLDRMKKQLILFATQLKKRELLPEKIQEILNDQGLSTHDLLNKVYNVLENNDKMVFAHSC